MTRRVAFAVSLVATMLLAGCTVPWNAERPTPTNDATIENLFACPSSASFSMPGLYDALPHATQGTFTHSQPYYPALPFENETLRRQWRDYSLGHVERTFIAAGPNGDDPYPTLGELYPLENGTIEIAIFAPVNTTNETVLALFDSFTTNTTLIQPAQRSDLVDALLSSRHISAQHDDTPDNATPNGDASGVKPSEPGSVYGEAFNVQTNLSLRLEALQEELGPIDSWNRTPFEGARVRYDRNGWTFQFELPQNSIHLMRPENASLSITAIPTDGTYLVIQPPDNPTWNETRVRAEINMSFQDLGLAAPVVGSVTQFYCSMK